MCHLNQREIHDIVIRTIRAHRRLNEVVAGSMCMVDRVFEFLRSRNIELTDRQWELFDDGLDTLCGQNLVHPETRDFMVARMAQYGFPQEFVEAMLGAVGYIYLYIDSIVHTIWWLQIVNERRADANFVGPHDMYSVRPGESTAHYAQRMTMFFMAHERYHTCQQFSDIAADYGTEVVAASQMLEEHDGYQCEIEANNFGSFQTVHPLGMYYNAF